jgi:spermidine/putrescine-binding protein
MLNKPFDPNNDYSIPYIWGATAIGVNSDAIDPKTVTSWADLWKPEYKSSLLLTDARARWRCVSWAIPAIPPIRKRLKRL